MLSAEQCTAKAGALAERAAVERMSSSRFRAFAESMGFFDMADEDEDEREGSPMAGTPTAPKRR